MAEAKEKEKVAYDPGQYWNQRLEKEFSLAGVGHSSVGLRFNRWAYRVRRHNLLRALYAHDVNLKNARALELGFGTGFYLDIWRAEGVKHVLGYDIAEIAVNSAREAFADTGWTLRQGDIGAKVEMGDFEGTCDLATAFDVLFHLVEDASWNGALDNMARALKPGGHAIIFDKFQTRESAVSHVKRRTLAAYTEALSARGFEILSIKPIFFLMNSPTDLSGVKKFFAKTAWSLSKTPYKLGRIIGLGEFFGGIMGGLLYGPELLLTRIFSSGPSTKLLLARKK